MSEAKDIPIDPTQNVLKLVEEAVKRIDDLVTSERRRSDDLRISESNHINKMLEVRSRYEDKFQKLIMDHTKELREAESKRIDAINAGIVSNVAISTEKAIQQAALLATQISETAETLRKQTESVISNINERINKIEQIQYTSEGRTGVTDPMMNTLIGEVKNLSKSITSTKSEKKGRTDVWGWIVAGIVALIAILNYLKSI